LVDCGFWIGDWGLAKHQSCDRSLTAIRNPQSEMINLTGKRVVIMGLGRFGGGIGAARFCAKRDAKVLVTDIAPRDQLASSLAQLEDLPIEYRLGEHRERDFTHADLIVANPAVKPNNPYLCAAAEANVPVTSEIRLLIAQLPNRLHTIGITGTAGKSTVTAMIGHILGKALGHNGVHVGGNLGGSLLDKLNGIEPDHWVVLELSSFMLHSLREDEWSPHIAVVTNIMPNHLVWHGLYEHYLAAKQTILRYQNEKDVAVLGQTVKHWPTSARTVKASDAPRGDWQLLLPGDHNRINAAMAISVSEQVLAQGSNFNLDHALEDFPGLPHRLQFVGEYHSVRYFNDSKSTTPEAAVLALQSFKPNIVHVILGGYDKGSDLKPLAGLASEHCRAIYTIGTTGNIIADMAEGSPGQAPIIRCRTLQRAMEQIAGRTQPGDVVLLSPGCASLDQFQNYQQRGDAFVEAVLKYTNLTSSHPD